jgi:hypothetical protein
MGKAAIGGHQTEVWVMSRFIRPGPGWDSDPRVPRAADAADREVITAAADWLRSNGPTRPTPGSRERAGPGWPPPLRRSSPFTLSGSEQDPGQLLVGVVLQ